MRSQPVGVRIDGRGFDIEAVAGDERVFRLRSAGAKTVDWLARGCVPVSWLHVNVSPGQRRAAVKAGGSFLSDLVLQVSCKLGGCNEV